MFSFVHKLFGGNNLTGGMTRVGFLRTPKESKKVLKYANYPVDLCSLDKKYLLETMKSILQPIAKEFKFGGHFGSPEMLGGFPGPTCHLGVTFKAIEFPTTSAASAECYVFIDFTQELNRDLEVIIQWSYYCDHQTDKRRYNLLFVSALQSGIGKVLNKFLQDAHLPLAVMRKGLGMFSGEAENALQQSLGSAVRLEARGFVAKNFQQYKKK